ncbi:MAG: hypothetical protein LBB14_02170, partial [Puniceicoccales bacterium]|nr:hypothetical protein [Puniceicoccales bacterium]
MSSIAISASRQAANGPARLNPNDEEGPVSREDLAKFAFAWREVKCVPEISIAKVSALSSFDPDDCEFVDDPYVLKDVYEHIAAIILLHGGRYAMDLLAPLYWPGGTYIPALISDFFCVRFSDLETGTDVDVEKIILSGGIDREAIRRYLLQLVISHDLANDAVKSLLFEVLLALFMSRKLQSLLMALIANGPASPVGTLSPFRDRPIGALQYAQQTFLAACNPIRQDHCACLCFAASFAIALQWNSPKRMFKVIAELLLRGWLSVPVPGEDSSSERIAANVFEGPPAEGEVSYAFALQLMLVRTLADGSKVNAFSAEDTSDFRTSIARGDIQKFLALTGEINDQLTALGLTELKLVCGKYPRYDSFSENTSSGRSGRRGRGLWFFPIGHSLEELVPPRIFFPNYIARLQKMAEENCGLSAVISKAVELSRLPMLDHSQGGGAAADIISLMPKVKF